MKYYKIIKEEMMAVIDRYLHMLTNDRFGIFMNDFIRFVCLPLLPPSPPSPLPSLPLHPPSP
jgi:hypothetical protein